MKAAAVFLEFVKAAGHAGQHGEKDLAQQKDLLKRRWRRTGNSSASALPSGSQEELRGSEKRREGGADILCGRSGGADAAGRGQAAGKKQPAQDLLQQHLPRLSEEKQRVREILIEVLSTWTTLCT